MEQEPISQTALDQMVVTEQGQIQKAVLPYLPVRGQQILSIFEKANELRNTIALFSGRMGQTEMSAASTDKKEPLEMISEIRKFCYGNSRKQLDSIANMLAMAEMFQVMNDSASKGEEKNG